MDGQRTVIHPLSGIAPLPQFELWSVPLTQVSVLKDIESETRPLSTISSNQPIEFVINSAIDEYVNLNETYIFIKARVKLSKDDKTELKKEDWDSIFPVQYFLHSIFSQCDIRIGDKEVTLAPQTYHYRAYLEALLGFSKQAKNSYMRASMWTKTRAERNDIIRPEVETSKEGRYFQLMGRLHTDLTFQDKSILGGTEIRIKLIPNDPKFYFNCNEGLKPELELREVTLHVHKSKVYPSIVDAHARALASGNTRYAITRSEVRYQSIPIGQLDAMLENVIRGQIPRRIFVCLVDTTTYNGSYTKDPYTFKHFDLNYLAAYVDGVQYPSRPFTPDFEAKLYTREFMELYIAMNQNRTDTYMDIDPTSFATDNAIFAFDLSPDLSNGPGAAGHVNCIMNGTLRLHFRFKRQLTAPVNVLLYCEFENLIEIDANRKVTTNFN
jgi:hypothetical protein